MQVRGHYKYINNIKFERYFNSTTMIVYSRFKGSIIRYRTFFQPHLKSVLFFSTDSKGGFIKDRLSDVKLPDPPQDCCMSGCSNCVWIAYAEELAKILNDGGETARQKILEHIKDPNLRTFLLLELSHLFKEKE